MKPIDAEAVYLNPRVGLCRWDAPVAAVLDMLRWHKGACFVAGVGAIGAAAVAASPGSVVRMPANVPHALEAKERTKMLLVMLREQPS